MRGNPRPPVSHRCKRGSIPAYAGEPCSPGATAARQGVYPRVCGGTCGHIPAPMRRLGLSPRMRGNPARVAGAGRRPGSIPAYAGEPPVSRGWRGYGRVYPRVCGGTPSLRRNACRMRGLSPRMRGNRRRAVSRQDGQRSIPAYAGEPFVSDNVRKLCGVYPRVCGGTPWHFDSDPYYHICQGNDTAPTPPF